MIGSFQLNSWTFWGTCYIQPTVPPKQPSQHSRPPFTDCLSLSFMPCSMYLGCIIPSNPQNSLGLDAIRAACLQRNGLRQLSSQFHWARTQDSQPSPIMSSDTRVLVPTFVCISGKAGSSSLLFLTFHLPVVHISPPSSPSPVSTSCSHHRITWNIWCPPRLASSENSSEKPTSLFYF